MLDPKRFFGALLLFFRLCNGIFSDSDSDDGTDVGAGDDAGDDEEEDATVGISGLTAASDVTELFASEEIDAK
jgi:hypothetical protein